jgi:putative ABC transport system permease protein
MDIKQNIIEALESLSSNKVRSGLTILGIVIGVAAVIAMLGVGQGAQNTITGSISGIGTNLLFVFPGNFTQEVRNPKPLTLSDVRAISDPFNAPHIYSVAPAIEASVVVTYGKEQASPYVDGVTPEYTTIRNYDLLEGEFINESHELGRASVALIGVDVADKLFDRRDGLVGETIRINGQPFRIIGVLGPKGGGTFGSQDNVILVPFSTAQARLIRRSSERVDLLLVQAVDAESVGLASEEVSQILRTRHRTELGADDFTVFSQDDFVQTAATITGVLTIFLGGIAAISLLVGGIGIMNIMLVTVTERTREIGLRKAVGARKADIRFQFIVESAMLSLGGGAIGILMGWGISLLIGQIASSMGTSLTPVIKMSSVLMATLFSAGVGLFFGLYPANRAANLQPVEALRVD